MIQETTIAALTAVLHTDTSITSEQIKACVDLLKNHDSPGRMPKTECDLRLVTYTEAAKRLNLSRPTVYRLAKAGRLEVVPLDGVNRIRLKSVIAIGHLVKRHRDVCRNKAKRRAARRELAETIAHGLSITSEGAEA